MDLEARSAAVTAEGLFHTIRQLAESQRKDVKVLWTYLVSSAILIMGTLVLSIVSQSIPTAAFLIFNALENVGSWAMLMVSTLVLQRSDDTLRSQQSNAKIQSTALKESSGSESRNSILKSLSGSSYRSEHVTSLFELRSHIVVGILNVIYVWVLALVLAIKSFYNVIERRSVSYEIQLNIVPIASCNLLLDAYAIAGLRSYARRFADTDYSTAEDMNGHGTYLHVLLDAVKNVYIITSHRISERKAVPLMALCMAILSALGFIVTMAVPLITSAWAILINEPSPSLEKSLQECVSQITLLPGVESCVNIRFWEIVPGSVIGSLDVILDYSTFTSVKSHQNILDRSRHIVHKCVPESVSVVVAMKCEIDGSPLLTPVAQQAGASI